MAIEKALPEDALPAAIHHYARDTITLGWEDRRHVRGQRRSDGGIVFGLSLPRGTVLRGGDCLVVDEAMTVVVVVERPSRYSSSSRAHPKNGDCSGTTSAIGISR